MALRTDWSDKACSIARGIDAVGDPWVLLIIRELLTGTTRFERLRTNLGIAHNILANRLHHMVERGLAVRVPYREGGRERFEYQPTEAAADVLPILHCYALWAQQHTPTDSERRRILIVCRSCGTQSTTGEVCSGCGETLTPETTAWVKPRAKDRTPQPLRGPAPL